MFREIGKLWNGNFNKGVTIFQICLMVGMIWGGISNNEPLVLFAMVSCLFAYFEPNEDRLSIKGWYSKGQLNEKESK